MAAVSDKHLEILISGLEDYKKAGVIDPWVLKIEDVIVTIEPLDVLTELKELREANHPGQHSQPEKLKADTSQPADRPPIHLQQSEGQGLAD